MFGKAAATNRLDFWSFWLFFIQTDKSSVFWFRQSVIHGAFQQVVTYAVGRQYRRNFYDLKSVNLKEIFVKE